MRPAIVLLTIAIIPTVYAQHLKVSRVAWDGLSSEERAAIQTRQVVEIFEIGTFGLVFDAQGADRSDPGTSAGAFLGSMGAQAAYIDRAFGGGRNYSVLTQLGFAVLGGVIGSAVDRPPSTQYQFRYALRLPNGDVQYADALDAQPFRHPPGVCLSIPALLPIAQSVCNHGPDDLRRSHGLLAAAPAPRNLPEPLSMSSAAPAVTFAPTPTGVSAALVYCKLGTAAPVLTTSEKCTSIGGSQ